MCLISLYFIYHFWEKRYPLHISSLELFFPVNSRKCNDFKICRDKCRSLWPPDKSQNSNVLSTFSQPLNAISLAMLGLSQTERNDRFPHVFHILHLVKSLPFHIPEAWKSSPFRAEPPLLPIIVSTLHLPGNIGLRSRLMGYWAAIMTYGCSVPSSAFAFYTTQES